MENICLCHRPITGGAEYAVVEHFPARGTNEIWNRGWNAVEVLKAFAQEQRQALQVWTEDMTAQVKEFLAEKYPGQDYEPRGRRLHAPIHSRGLTTTLPMLTNKIIAEEFGFDLVWREKSDTAI